MRRWWVMCGLGCVLSLVLTACGGGASGPVATGTGAAVPPTLDRATVVATSAAPTAVAQAMTGDAFPAGTLILTQVGNPVAQLPNRQTISLTDERFSKQAAVNGRYGVRFKRAASLLDLELVDFAATPNAVKAIPQGQGFSEPVVTWREDSAGFAFFDFVAPDKLKNIRRTIFYYDVASGQTRQLLPERPADGKLAASIAFSPDGRFLLYAENNADSEGIGGQDGQTFLLDMTNSQTQPLPQAVGFNQWLRDGKGFITIRSDQNNVINQVFVFNFADLGNPKMVTPAGYSDGFVDVSPDGKRLIVSSAKTGPNGPTEAANIYMQNPDGSNRRKLTNFTDVEQNITQVIWGNDGIYYSVFGASGPTAWRMDLDGTNAKEIAKGDLNAIVGVR